MSDEFYFEADSKLHRATWMPTLQTWYCHIHQQEHSWQFNGRMDSEEVAVARKLEISRDDARRKYFERTEECQIVAEAIAISTMIAEGGPDVGGHS